MASCSEDLGGCVGVEQRQAEEVSLHGGREPRQEQKVQPRQACFDSVSRVHCAKPNLFFSTSTYSCSKSNGNPFRTTPTCGRFKLMRAAASKTSLLGSPPTQNISNWLSTRQR